MEPILRIYDSLTGERRELNNSPKTIYLCGPTVYDHVHIGNVAPVMVFDFLIRYLVEKNIDFTYIHNITDIDDKIINRAGEESKREEEISEYYLSQYLEILKKLNIVPPTHMPKVSDHIDDILDTIVQLESKGFTEASNGDVMFKLNLIDDYGELSKQKLDSLTNLSDFCLWKRTTEGKKWTSKWGEGRPGWHTECFTFIDRYVGGPVDIHGGGVDLKFPHHENENAHCRALYGRPLAKIWIHMGHLSTSEGKISKSGNKKFLVKDLLSRYSPNVIRYLFLTSRYSQPTLVSEEKFQEISREINDYGSSINRAKSHLLLAGRSTEINVSPDPEFLSHLEDDLNLPNILTWLQRTNKALNASIKQKKMDEMEILHRSLSGHLHWLGFVFEDLHTPENRALLEEWRARLNEKNYAEADRIREILMERDIL